MLLVWLFAAANITFFLQSSIEDTADVANVANTAVTHNLPDLLNVDHLMATNATIQIAGLSVRSLHAYIGINIIIAILLTALLAMAIAIIDMRNMQARRSRH